MGVKRKECLASIHGFFFSILGASLLCASWAVFTVFAKILENSKQIKKIYHSTPHQFAQLWIRKFVQQFVNCPKRQEKTTCCALWCFSEWEWFAGW